MIADFYRRCQEIALHLTAWGQMNCWTRKIARVYLPIRGGSRKAIAKNSTPMAKARIKM
jgi:hypothetical protein